MKPLVIWLAAAVLVFGGLGGGYHFHLMQHPRKTLVAVDSSFPMKEVWGQVSDRIGDIGRTRYTRFCLITEKSRVHTWSPRLSWNAAPPYAPRNLSGFSDAGRFPELDQADRKILLTNAAPSETGGLKGWEIIRISP